MVDLATILQGYNPQTNTRALDQRRMMAQQLMGTGSQASNPYINLLANVVGGYQMGKVNKQEEELAMQQMELEKAMMLQQQANLDRDFTYRQEQGMIGGGETAPSSVREYQYFTSLSPEEQRKYLAMKRTTQSFDLGSRFGIYDPMTGQMQQEFAKDISPEKEIRLGTDEAGRQIIEPIVGGKVEREIEQEQREKQIRADRMAEQGKTVVRDVEEAKKIIKKSPTTTTGFGSFLSAIPTTNALELKTILDSVKGNIAVDSLLKIKAEGSGLGQVPQSQLNMLAGLLGGLDQAMSPERLDRMLDDIMVVYGDIVEKAGQDPRGMVWDDSNKPKDKDIKMNEIKFLGFE